MTEFCIEILFKNLDLSDEAVLAALSRAGIVAADAHDEHTVRVTAAIEAPNAVRAAATLVTGLRETVPNAKPVMAARDLVNITDIAERVGVTREAVRHWSAGKRRAGQFPDPIDAPGGQKIWEWASVHAWLRLNLGFWDGLTYPNHAELGAIDSFVHHCAEAAGASVRVVARNWSLVQTVDRVRSTVPASRHPRVLSHDSGWETAAAR
jgi:hypothetical protein